MLWWWLLLGCAMVAICWRLGRPVDRRNIQRGDFGAYFEALLVNSRKGAWIRISDETTLNVLFASKEDTFGNCVLFDVSLADGKGAPEAMAELGEMLAAQQVDIVGQSVTDNEIALVLQLTEGKAVKQATNLAIAIFDVLGASPGRGFRLQGKGNPDPEHWRPILRSLRREPKGSTSRRIGEEGLRLLDRRRKKNTEKR